MIELTDPLFSTAVPPTCPPTLELSEDNEMAIEIARNFLFKNNWFTQVGIDIDPEKQLKGFRIIPSDAVLLVSRKKGMELQINITYNEFISYRISQKETSS